MKPLQDFPLEARRAVRGVLCDIDDTLTTGGRLTAAAYGAMERLQQAGLLVIPVTGRPAGWCDHIARMWPVDAVVGENGAFYFRYDHATRRMLRRFVDDDATRAANRRRLAVIGKEIVAAVPGAAIASDQGYRESDLAIDFCEDVQPLPQSAIDKIVSLMQGHGLTAKASSIHVNCWFGAYDKLTMTKTLMRECFDTRLETARDTHVFVGDSPNDAPMFAYFPYAIGVANIRDFAGRLAHAPAYVTAQRGGAGFEEAADAILAAIGPREQP
ncbi:MAG: HAD-IIB family hydrolase [Burkholderiales bacterium]|nr:HAD-IIB family hydrolase [Burkholderiales bacterium]